MNTGKILVSEKSGNHVIKFEGDVRLTLSASLNDYMETIFSKGVASDVIVDMLDAECVDSTTLGLLAKLAMYVKKNFDIAPTMFCTDDSLMQIVESMGLDDLFDIIEQTPEQLEMGKPLEALEQDIDQIKQHVLEAHKLLALLNPEKSNEFMDLISSLENS